MLAKITYIAGHLRIMHQIVLIYILHGYNYADKDQYSHLRIIIITSGKNFIKITGIGMGAARINETR